MTRHMLRPRPRSGALCLLAWVVLCPVSTVAAAQEPAIVAVEEESALAGPDDEALNPLEEVDDRADLEERLNAIFDNIEERLFDLLASLPLLLIAVAILALFWVLSRWIGNRRRLYARVSQNRLVRDLVAQVVSTVVFVLGILLALEVLDATALVGAVLGAAGVIGLAVGFAFRDLVENYIASVLLSIRQPFAAGDHVVVGDREGKVVRLTSRATILMTLDGNHLRIPNAEVFKGTVLNYSTNPRRRLQFTVGVGVDEGLERVREIGMDVLEGMEGVLCEPAPLILIEQLGDSTVNLCFFAWVDQREVSLAKVKSEAIRQVKERFDAEGVSKPEPTYRVQMLEKAPPTAREKPPEPHREKAADIARETHLDQEIAEERARAEDLLTSEGRSE